MSIGAVSRATRIPESTLRTWERRYGFPSPERTAGGHRIYGPRTVEKLRLVARALELGHRPAQILLTSMEELRALLPAEAAPVGAVAPSSPKAEIGPSAAAPVSTARAQTAAPPLRSAATQEIGQWLEATRNLDSDALLAGLQGAHARLGLLRFLTDAAAPYLVRVGDAWAGGELQIFHEHFASEVLRGFLASTLRSLVPEESGPRVICATLPDEQHVLGLHMAAAVLALEGCRVLFVGPNTPLIDLRDCAVQAGAHAVILGISPTAGPASARAHLVELRRLIPAEVSLVAGGSGAPPGVPGVTHLDNLREIVPYVRRLRAGIEQARERGGPREGDR